MILCYNLTATVWLHRQRYTCANTHLRSHDAAVRNAMSPRKLNSSDGGREMSVCLFVCHVLCFSLPQYICSDLCEMLKSSLLLSLKTDLNSIHITAFHSTVCISKSSSLFSSSDHSNVHPVPLSLNGNGQLHCLPHLRGRATRET